jgi:hypothetical protein
VFRKRHHSLIAETERCISLKAELSALQDKTKEAQDARPRSGSGGKSEKEKEEARARAERDKIAKEREELQARFEKERDAKTKLLASKYELLF